MGPTSDTERSKGLLRLRDIYYEFPSQFWILVSGAFIDRLGGALLFPFFTLYITRKFDVGMTQVGVIFFIFSASSALGSMLGGALTDRFGRKGMLLFGLVMSAVSSLLMGLVGRIELFYATTVIVGLLANSGGPAQQAMVADLLPEKQRAQGFGILRVAVNLSFTIGPMIGGFLATQSYLLLFISDAVLSCITAMIVFLAIKETRPELSTSESQPGIAQAFGGYLSVLRDAAFVWFLAASALMVVVYMQMNTTLAVYLRDVHSVTEQYYGYILSLNAAIVVLFQFPITRWISKYRPLVIMAVGTLFYAVGFAMYGFVSLYILFLVAIVIITIGEMLVSPVGQALAAQFAPEDMRGRYMAVYGFSWVIPTAIGPLLAGLIMDNIDPHWVWFSAGLLGVVAAGAFYLLELRVTQTTYSAIDQRLDIMEKVEQGILSAEEAAQMLSRVTQGKWKTLSQQASVKGRRDLNIRVSNLDTGAVNIDLTLPLGLVSAALNTGGRLATDLNGLDNQELRKMISDSADHERPQKMKTRDNKQIEITVSRYNRDRTF
jgi:MFS family permease